MQRVTTISAAFTALSATLSGCGSGGSGGTTSTTTTSGAPTPSTSTPEPGSQVVRDLNHAWSGFNPNDDNSPFGVVISQADKWEDDQGHHWKCNQTCGNKTTNFLADCQVEGQLLNNAIVKFNEDSGRFALRYPSFGGWIYTSDALDKITKCSYAQTAGMEGRINHGCGCANGDAQSYPEYPCTDAFRPDPDHKPDQCPNACENWNPKDKRHWDPRKDDKMFANCKCTDPTKDEGTCFWYGPAFFSAVNDTDTYPNELHEMAVQRQSHTPTDRFTQVVIDAGVLEQEMRKNAKSVIKAFVIPVGKGTCGSECADAVFKNRQEMAKRYKFKESDIPVVDMDVTNSKTPFNDHDSSLMVNV